MLRSRHTQRITLYLAECLFQNTHRCMHLAAPKHILQGKRANWGTIGEAKGPIHIPNRKGASPGGETIPNCPIPPTHPLTHPRGRIHPKNRGRNQKSPIKLLCVRRAH